MTKIIIGTSQWYLSGINTYAINLARGLISAGFDAEILITNDPLEKKRKPIDRPSDIPIKELPVRKFATWSMRWNLLTEYLINCSPCIYLPNQDRAFSCASSILPESVKVIGVIHSDEEYHYTHLSRMGPYWNAVVCVSPFIESIAIKRYPHLKAKLVTIPNAVPAPPFNPVRSKCTDLRLIYAGRLKQYQKRIFDLPLIVDKLYQKNIPFKLTIAGDGDDQDELFLRIKLVDPESRVLFVGPLSNDNIIKNFKTHDVFLLTSEFEGLPMALLESMAQGCIPVVSKIESGIMNVIKPGANGFIYPIGDINFCVNILHTLYSNPDLRNIVSFHSHLTAKEGYASQKNQIINYINLFEKVTSTGASKNYNRLITGRAVQPDYFNPSLIGEIKRLLSSTLYKGTSKIAKWI